MLVCVCDHWIKRIHMWSFAIRSCFKLFEENKKKRTAVNILSILKCWPLQNSDSQSVKLGSYGFNGVIIKVSISQ